MSRAHASSIRMNTEAQPLILELADTFASGREIALSVAGFDVRGQLSLEGAHLHLAGREGTVTASKLVITNVTIMGRGLRIGGQELVGANVSASWGDSGVRLSATNVSIRALQVIGDHEPLDGTLVLEGVTLAELAVNGDDVRLAQLRIATTKADVAVPAHEADASKSSAPSTGSVVDRLLGVLDRLTGHVNVDLGLDLTVPVIGRRRATHHFRIPIDAGTIDYRRLEDNLSRLEDSLLDFSVRDEGLVLEVGIPFLPTRGKGKPIVTWSLDDADLALAHQQRVRLSILARPNTNGEHATDDGSEEKSSAVSVRKAHAAGLDVNLAVAQSAVDSPIRSIGSLVVAGDVTYATDESTEGVLRGRAENVDLGAIAAGRITLAGLRLDSASDVEVALSGMTPVRAKLVAQNLGVDGLHVAPTNVDARDAASNGAAGGKHSHAPHAAAK